MTSPPSVDHVAGQETPAEILGGRRSALDATVPALCMGLSWWVIRRSLGSHPGLRYLSVLKGRAE